MPLRFLRTLLLTSFILSVPFSNGWAQNASFGNTISITNPFRFLPGNDSTRKFNYTTLEQAKKLSLNQTAGRSLATCNTTTFYMHLPAAAGEKINLQELQTLPGGDFIAFGNRVLTNNQQEGIIIRMTNGGTIVSQQTLRINNQPATISAARIWASGNIVIAGIINSTSSVFVAELKDDLSTNWTNVFTVASAPLKVTLDLFALDVIDINLAVQLTGSIVYSTLTLAGSLIWSKQVQVEGLTDLIGFNVMLWNQVGLLVNVVRNGKRMVVVHEIEVNSGTITSAHILGNGSTENVGLKSGAFNVRLKMLSVSKKSANEFTLNRDIMYSSKTSEVKHTYTITGKVDFDITGAMDNAGDAMGFCLPKDGTMIFIRHFAYYQTEPEYTREYTVPVGASIAAITRSFDGGFLFGLNVQNSKELIFIKTDSIGVLSGCTYSDVPNQFNEVFSPVHTVTNFTDNTFPLQLSSAAVGLSNMSFTTQFDCKQNYCPADPVDDPCLSTYLKTFRSNSYVDAFGSNHLMRNNNHLMLTGRLDRVLGGLNQRTTGLKLFNEKGEFLKGVNIYLDNAPFSVSSKKMDDKSIMLTSYSTKGNIVYLTLTLVSDNLEVIWSKTIQNDGGFVFGYDGIFDVIKDEEGNYYLSGGGGGIFNVLAKVQVLKLDSQGNQVWLKTYALNRGQLSLSTSTTTKSSIIVVFEGSNNGGGSVSVRMNKNTGALENAFIYNNNNWSGGVYKRFLQFEGDRIYYVGDNGNSDFTMGLFDTLGRPIKFRTIKASSVPRAFTLKDGMLYGYYLFFNGVKTKEVLVKADSGLNIKYINEYDSKLFGYPSGMEVSNEGNIYMAGNYSHGGVNGSYYDPYLLKLSNSGELGTCGYTPSAAVIEDFTARYETITSSPLDFSYGIANIPIHFVPEYNGQQISAILCSSVPQCNSVKVSGVTAICKLNQEFTYKATKNASCNLASAWMYDTSFATIKSSTDSTITLTFKRTGATWLKARLNTGCTSYFDSLLLHIQQAPATFSLGNDTTLCPNDSITLNAGNGFNSYKWNDGSTDSIIKVKSMGKYFVRVDNVCNDVFADTIIITASIIPELSIGPDTTLCIGDTLRRTASSGFINYKWLPQPFQISNQSTTAAFIPQQNTTLTVRATTNQGCSATDTLLITIIAAPRVYLGADTSICANDSVTINAGNGYSQYRWSTGTNAQRLSLKTAGVYSVIAKAANGCYATDTLVLQEVYQKPVVNLGNDFNVCTGDVKRLDAGNFTSYKWHDGSVGKYYTASNKGAYSVTVTDNNNCFTTDTILLKSLLPLPANFLRPIDSLCQYDKMEVIARGNYNSYAWSTGSVKSTLVADKPGVYRLSVTNANGCTASETIRIVSKNCLFGVFIPSAFTPNADGTNDVFRARVYGNVITFQLTIYNRFGETVFSTTDRYKGWDGTVNSIPQNPGTFVYKCTYHLEGSKPTAEKGTIVLIR